jgi:hydroxylysine kinase
VVSREAFPEVDYSSAAGVKIVRCARDAPTCRKKNMTNSVDAFMATMVARAEPVPIERVLALARAHYGLSATAARLTGERDENIRLTAADGAQYVFKIANPAEDPLVTELPGAALRYVAGVDPGFPCPRVLPTLRGEYQFAFADDAGSSRTARILTYLPGQLVGSVARSSGQRAACGAIGARLTQALRGFEHAAAHRPIIWDVRQARFLRQLLGQMPGFPYHAPASELLGSLLPEIETRLPALRHQIVHNDLNPLNILVDPADATRVSGVIDFGDVTHTALIADVAVGAAELIPHECRDPDVALRAVLDFARAYHAREPLLRDEQAILGVLVATRLLMNVVVHEWHVHHNPDGGHYVALESPYMHSRIEIGHRLLLEDICL